jgi:hypothetical protein
VAVKEVGANKAGWTDGQPRASKTTVATVKTKLTTSDQRALTM